jgi:putative salt-induced outer membrane protein YdiY
MRHKHYGSLLLVAAFACLSFAANADEIRLKNGDLITGKIVKKETSVVAVETSYAGQINIQWSEIDTIKSDKPVHLVLTDGSNLHGPLQENEDGVASIELAEADVDKNLAPEEKEFDLREVRYINPTPDLTGEGVRWTGHVNAGGALTQGNTDTKTLRFDGETIARTLKNRYTLTGEFNRAEDHGDDTRFDSRARAKYDRFFTDQWYGYINTSLENDRFRDLRLRRMLGVGNGYQIFETPSLNLSIEGGVNHISEDYYSAEDNSYPGLRWALKYDQLLFGGKTQLFHEHETLVGFEEENHILFFSKTGLRFPLVFNMNASTQFNYDWDSDPSEGRERADSTLMFTLGYGW